MHTVRNILLVFLFVWGRGLYAQDSRPYLSQNTRYEGAGYISGNAGDTIHLQDTVPEMLLTEKAENLFGKLFKYVPIPYLGYSTETSLTFGLIKYNAFKIHSLHVPDSLVMLSSVSLYGFYTLNKQYEIKLKVDVMSGNNRYNPVFEFRFRDFPMYYFGVGNRTPEEGGVLTDFKNLLISPEFNYKFYGKNYLGAKYVFNNFIRVETSDTTTEFPDLTVNEGIQSGFGIKYFREGRNNRLETTKGSYIYLSYDFYNHVFGSRFDYGYFTVDLRKYFTPVPRLTFAGQLYSEIKSGDVPVQSLAVIGGKYRMRGIYRGRYRDKTLAMAQLEMRFPIVWIIGGAVFGGMGQVGPRLTDFKGNGFHYAGGGGLRICIDKATSSMLRVDVGFSNEGYTLFLGFGEAF